MTKEEIEKKLDDIVDRNFGESYHEHECSFEDCYKMVREAFDLGKNSKKCKEDPDNPYHIDYKRQTKLDL